ncbi:MAG: SOS response-associated peptidase [Myxococcales bacterium]|nr:SOS response-associated peptidase [Myxococcales bacterium]
MLEVFAMCGRYQLAIDPKLLERSFGAQIEMPFGERYNIAPTQRAPAVRVEEGVRVFRSLRWGLVPGWAKDLSIGNKMINARGETVAEKPSFRSAFRKRRCLVPSTGFYEWKRQGKAKQPHRIRLADAEFFAMAGLWEFWQSPEGAPIETFTIITCDPAGALGDLHNRMPVILDPARFDEWLDPRTPGEALQRLIAPRRAEELEIVPVSDRINSVYNDDPEAAQPIGQASLFRARQETTR